MLDKKDLRPAFVLLFILVTPLLVAIAASAVDGWTKVFDDSFITYRYAKNFASGHGLVWNVGEAPTEGYTNPLLVLVLAPFIKFGFDPLFITRVLSYVSALLVSIILYRVAKNTFRASMFAAMVSGLIFLYLPQTRYLCLVGLETVIYSFFLLLSFHVGVRFVVERRMEESILLGLLVIITMLIRPEAALLYLSMLMAYFFINRAAGRPLDRTLIGGISVLLIGGGAYLLWKVNYFGSLLPNPFYIKASGGSFFKDSGLQSVLSFYREKWIYFLLLYPTWRLVQKGEINQREQANTALLFGGILIGVYSIFFAHAETLMDINGRFMYPVFGILLYMLIPVFTAIVKYVEDRWRNNVIGTWVFAFLIIMIVNSRDVFGIYANAQTLLLGSKEEGVDDTLMQKEYRVAKALSKYHEIKNIRIAFGDAGVIAYFTEAPWLDVVGLNDSYIAKTRDKKALVDYFFEWSPDLAINPGNKDFSWISYGHGPLGDYSSWLTDSRWDGYEYIGTCKVSGDIYDLQFFVKKSSPHREGLTRFLKDIVLDGRYVPMPFEIGSTRPDIGNLSVWESFGDIK